MNSINQPHIKEAIEQAIELIKEFEGLRLNAYTCSAGKLTIGYGHVILPGENYSKITQAKAEQLLLADLDTFVSSLLEAVLVELKPHQLASLLSLIFNIGTIAFKNSTLLKKINAKQEVAQDFLSWKYVGKEINRGLLNRRIRELAYYQNVTF